MLQTGLRPLHIRKEPIHPIPPVVECVEQLALSCQVAGARWSRGGRESEREVVASVSGSLPSLARC